MIHPDKVKYLQIALAMEGIAISLKTADIVVTSYEEILIRRGKFRLKDAVRIEKEIENKYSGKIIPVEDKPVETIDEPILERVEGESVKLGKRGKYKPRQTAEQKNTEKKEAEKMFPIDVSLTGNMLGAWLRKDATIKKLQSMNGKYGAGTPVRLRTLVLKYGKPDLLHTDIGMVTKPALLSVKRTGEVMWTIFSEARDMDRSNSLS